MSGVASTLASVMNTTRGNGSVPCRKTGRHDETLQMLNHEKAITYIPVMIFMLILMIAGILGNALVIYVYNYRFKKTPSNRFIIWMAILDLFTCVIGVPFEIFDLARPYTFDRPWGCKFLRFVSSTSVITSSLVLIAVAFDRYFKAFKPFRRLSVKSTNRYNALTLLIGICLSLPAMWIFGLKSTEIYDHDVCYIGTGCSTDDNMLASPFTFLYYGILLIVYLVLIVFQIILYGRLGKEIIRRKRRLSSATIKSKDQSVEPESSTCLEEKHAVLNVASDVKDQNVPNYETSTLSKKKDRALVKVRIGRTTLIFFCVAVAFIVSFLPHIITKILQALFKDFDNLSVSGDVLYNFFTRTQFINNAINPLIYGFLNPKFRDQCADAAAISCLKEPNNLQSNQNVQRKNSNVSQSC